MVRIMKESKFLIILTIIILENMNAIAQEWDHEYVPFIGDGKVWNCTVRTPEVILDEINCIFTMKGDTLIDEKLYKKVFCQFIVYYGDGEQHYYCAVREEAYRVFIVAAETKEEKLLYDFSHPQETLILSYDDYKFARGSGYRNNDFPTNQMIFGLSRTEDGINFNKRQDDWIEGVGSVNVNPFSCELICDEPSFGYSIDVVSCINEGEYLYLVYWMEKPTTMIKETFRNIPNALIYDLQGRSFSTMPKKGVYIQNGKKRLVK